MTESDSEVAAPAKSKKRHSFARELLETAVLTIAIFLVVRVAVQNFRVEGESMEPSLHNSEYILVNKVDYMVQSPQRGDVIVFRAVPAGRPDSDFIKRIIGLPGDLVSVHNGSVFVNGHRVQEAYIASPPDYTFQARRVPSGDYFVLGDNRNNSFDSSRWPTPWLPRNDIIGKAWIAYWPLPDLTWFRPPSYSLN